MAQYRWKTPNKYGYAWKCPIEDCDACSKKTQSHSKAVCHGRSHLRLKHGIRDMDPIVKKVNYPPLKLVGLRGNLQRKS